VWGAQQRGYACAHEAGVGRIGQTNRSRTNAPPTATRNRGPPDTELNPHPRDASQKRTGGERAVTRGPTRRLGWRFPARYSITPVSRLRHPAAIPHDKIGISAAALSCADRVMRVRADRRRPGLADNHVNDEQREGTRQAIAPRPALRSSPGYCSAAQPGSDVPA
jgi:hypothetical protein